MDSDAAGSPESEVAARRYGAAATQHSSVAAGTVILIGAGAVALFGPLLAPYNPSLPSGLPLLSPGGGYPLGTNDIGQDILSQWLWAARSSLLVAGSVTVLSTALSWGIGLAAGFWRQAEAPLMALTDLLLALPSLLLYLLVVVLLGPSRLHIVLTLGLLSWPDFARVVRAQVIASRGAPHVEAARALGATPLRVALRHVLPATYGLLPAKIVLTVRFALFADATLSFLGLGDTSAQSWGSMLGTAFNYPLLFAGHLWLWWTLPPALSIALVVLATTWLATGVGVSREGTT